MIDISIEGCLLIVFFIYLFFYSCHFFNGKEKNRIYNYVSFFTFLKWYKKYENNIEIRYSSGDDDYDCWESHYFVNKEDESQSDLFLDSSTIRIENKNMILYPFHDIFYYFFLFKLKRNIEANHKRDKSLWKVKIE